MRVRWICLTFALLLVAALSGCSVYYKESEEPLSITGLYLEVPANDARFYVLQSVDITARATTGPGITLSEMWLQVDNRDTLRLAVRLESGSADGSVWVGTGQWPASVAGDHRLRVRAVTQAGEEATSDPITVHIFTQPTPQPIMPGPTTTPVVELTADATSLTAGSCTTLRWQVSGVQPQSIELNGQPVAAQGEQQVCLCRTTTYDLIVLAEDKYVQSVTINVTGECTTPTPPPQRAIWFQADPVNVRAGGCTTLSWKTDPNVRSVTLNGQPVEWTGSRQFCALCASQTYTLEVLWSDGARDVRTVAVNVTGACVTPTPPPTPKPTPLPQASINFWADATMIPAGTCTTIHWRVENVQAVYFNGQGVAGEGTHQACPQATCENYTLDVVLRDGSHDIRTLTICLTVTPPPPKDTTPPPVPAPLSPGNTNESRPPTQYCPVTLRWQSVSDPSGVTYRVHLDKRNNVGSWSTIGTWTTTATEYAVPQSPLFCDYTDYRWRVQAEDGAGNRSDWSVWFFYAMPVP